MLKTRQNFWNVQIVVLGLGPCEALGPCESLSLSIWAHQIDKRHDAVYVLCHLGVNWSLISSWCNVFWQFWTWNISQMCWIWEFRLKISATKLPCKAGKKNTNIFPFPNQISFKYLMLAILQQQSGHYEAREIPKSDFFLVCTDDNYADAVCSKLIQLIKFYFVTQFCGTDALGT